MIESTVSRKIGLVAILLLLPSHRIYGNEGIPAASRKDKSRSPSMKNIAGKSDRERAELRGSVRTCVEERTFDLGKLVTTTEFDLDGRILSRRHVNADGSESLNTHSYDPEGRLLRSSWGKPGSAPASETINFYDGKGRLLSVINRGHVFDQAKTGSEELGAATETIESYSYDESGRLNEIRATGEAESHTKYEYDGRGGKTMVRTFAPKKPQDKLVAIAGSPFDTAQAGYGVPDGGNVTTIYNQRDVPTEVRVHDAQGHLLTRSLRSYDAHGQVSEDKQVVESPEFMLRSILPAEVQDHLTPEMLEEGMTLFGGRSGFYGTSYTYDAQNRVTHLSRRMGPMREETNTTYNEHGDKGEERTVRTGIHGRVAAESGSPEEGLAAEPKDESEVHYSYQYDSQGNWTEEIVSYRSRPDEAFKDSSTTHHQLTYY